MRMSDLRYLMKSYELDLRMDVAEMLAKNIPGILIKEAYGLTKESFNNLSHPDNLHHISNDWSKDYQFNILISRLYSLTKPLASEFVREKTSALETI